MVICKVKKLRGLTVFWSPPYILEFIDLRCRWDTGNLRKIVHGIQKLNNIQFYKENSLIRPCAFCNNSKKKDHWCLTVSDTTLLCLFLLIIVPHLTLSRVMFSSPLKFKSLFSTLPVWMKIESIRNLPSIYNISYDECDGLLVVTVYRFEQTTNLYSEVRLRRNQLFVSCMKYP